MNKQASSGKPSVIILTPGFPASEHDTTCLPHIQQFCLAARQEFQNSDLVIVAFQYPFKRDVYTWHGMEVHALAGRNRGSLHRAFTWLRAWRTLSKLKSTRNVAGLLSLWLGETALVGKNFAARYRLPHYTWLQGQDAKKENRYVRRMRARGEELIAISGFNRQQLLANHGISAFMVAQNGINAAAFPPLNTGTRNIHVLGAGSLIPLKNYEAFVRIIHELKKTDPEVTAVLIGAGPDERKLQELAFRLGLEHNLKFAGSLPHREVLNHMNRSRVFLHTSTYEGLSTVTLEALFSGCQVIASLPVADHEVANFRLCSSDDEMTAAVRKALENGPAAGRVLVHDMHDTARRIIGLYGLSPAG